jgi:hypothetical protein
LSDDDEYKGVLKVLSELHASWLEYQKQLTGEISEYKKTVNNAISLLATESLTHQTETKRRLEDDATERRARQAKVDSDTAQVREEMLTSRAETLSRLDASAATVREEMLTSRAETLARLDTSAANVREDMLTSRAETLARLDATNAHSAQHERRAGRERIGLSIGMGCMLTLMLVTLIVLVALLISLYWRPS